VYVPMLQKPSLPNSFEATDQASHTYPLPLTPTARDDSSSWVLVAGG
jgi:hypothetical protein